MATKVYTTRGGETLLSIATNLTLSPAYWEGIANFNGFSGEQTSPGYVFAPGEKIGIPEEWLKPGAPLAPLPGGPLAVDVIGAGSRLPAAAPAAAAAIPWGYIAIGVGALLLVAALSGRRR